MGPHSVADPARQQQQQCGADAVCLAAFDGVTAPHAVFILLRRIRESKCLPFCRRNDSVSRLSAALCLIWKYSRVRPPFSFALCLLFLPSFFVFDCLLNSAFSLL